MIITLDGESSAGKGTLAAHLAKKLGFFCLNTGLIYRSCANKCLENNIPLNNKDEVVAVIKEMKEEEFLQPEDSLMMVQIAATFSIIAAHQEVRELLLPIQRSLSEKALLDFPGVIAEGRDMGTVVFPEARLKLFLVANLEIRTKRRYEQLQSKGLYATYNDVLKELRARDERDYERPIAPMMPAHSAFVLDTSDMNADEVLAQACTLVKEVRKDIKKGGAL